jgi:ribosomal protein S18 acetylase RimI-like enzyme
MRPHTVSFRRFEVGTPDHEKALALREAVLRKPLGLTLSAEELREEPNCFHLGGFDGERLVAVLLLKPLDERTLKMRQVAIDPELQRRGIGNQLVAFAEQFARERGCELLIAHARESAVAFYRKLGYATSGDTFIETTIPHRLVSKRLI